MSKIKNSLSSHGVVQFVPAELKKNKEWIIVYRCFNPFKKILERYRLRVPSVQNTKERVKLANSMVAEINRKLSQGWNPLLESGHNLETVENALDAFIQQLQKEVDDEVKRIDTLRTYGSYVNIIGNYSKQRDKIKFAAEINREYIVRYLDWIYITKGNSPVSYNNHLNFWGNLCGWMVGRGMIKENFARGIQRKKKQPKKRKVIPNELKDDLKRTLLDYNFHYYTLCMTTYFCFIRGTELTKIKVSHVNMSANYIMIDGNDSKNKKTETITIPNPLKILLEQHLQKANRNDYLFSKNEFKPGPEKLKPKKISDTWNKIRQKLNLGLEFQFYSLKDTGITDMLKSGIPMIKVRDQARHHDMKITELYTPRIVEAESEIVDLNFDF
jgi:integrase